MRYKTNYQVTHDRYREMIDTAECEYCDSDVGELCMQMVGTIRTDMVAFAPHKPRQQLAFKIRKQREEEHSMSSPYSNYRGERESAIEREERRMERALIMAQQAQDRIDFLASLPDEPTTIDPDGALVIWFEKKFPTGGKWYTYAAVKASDGLWYSTGPRAPKGYAWEQLVEWMFADGGRVRDDTIWKASEYTPL